MDEVKVVASGPLFDGTAVTQLSVFLDEAVDLVAAAAEEAVDRNLAASIRKPSSPPRYQAQINIRHDGLDRVINDNGVIYGPWLEGVGSRNATTRFKGYASFRRARQDIEQRVPAIVEPALMHFIAAVDR
jgi:hypothetical protein